MDNNAVRVIPLGGLGAIGKNMTVVEYGDALIVIDAGLMFPDEEMFGIDLVLPDFTYVLENRDKALAVILTHGHEDHVGALPYFLRDCRIPVYGTRLTLGLVNGKLGEHHLQGEVELNEIKAGDRLELGPFALEFLDVCHSIPDGVGVVVETPEGTIVHSGDFKLDQTPVDCRVTQLPRFGEIGSRGVTLLLSDSTNAETPGFTRPEKSVGETLDNIVAAAKGRIIIASFASHIHRIQQVLDVAHRHGRSVAVVGRSMTRNVNIAANLGYLDVPAGVLVRAQDIASIANEDLVILSTGSQGEPMSALSRMASLDHHLVNIEPGDTVVISAKPVPGNERSVSRTINRLFAAGADVIYESIAPVHVSGHASAEELKMLLNVVRPKYFMPVHGEQRHLHFHARLARSVGIPDDHIFVLENGDVLEMKDGEVRRGERVQGGMIYVDGLNIGGVEDVVLRDRFHLSNEGIVTVVVAVDSQTGSLQAGPEISLRGFAASREMDEVVEGLRERLLQELHSDEVRGVTDSSILKSHVHDVAQKFLFKQTRQRPMVMPIVVEV
ncbi:MAG: ribonuclease J [Thermoleophilia bacterium]